MSNLVIRTNLMALNVYRNLQGIGLMKQTAVARLSSGYRITHPKDDAAGFAISRKMRAQIRGLDMASRNTQDAISMLQTAEGALQEVDNMLQRIRELVVQAANDTNDYSTADRQKIQDEIDQLTEGIDQIAAQSEFNGMRLLDGSLSGSGIKSQMLSDVNTRTVGLIGETADNFETLEDAAGKIAADAQDGEPYSRMGGLFAESVSLDAVISAAKDAASPAGEMDIPPFDQTAFDSLENLEKFISEAEKAIADLNSARASAAAVDASASEIIGKGIDGLKGQADFARQLYAGAKLAENEHETYTEINKLKGDGLWFQTGANSMQGIEVGIGGVSSDKLGIGYGHGTSKINVMTGSGAEISAYIGIVDSALDTVSAMRGRIGAVQNRLGFTKSMLDVCSENLSAAESRITDADMGKEMMKLAMATFLEQVGVMLLAQANQSAELVLRLLR